MFIYGLCLAVLAAPYSEQSREFHNQCIENDEVNRHVRDMAIAMGLEKVDANDLVQDLVGTLMPPYLPDVEYWKEGLIECFSETDTQSGRAAVFR